jgi:hypothetical protein
MVATRDFSGLVSSACAFASAAAIALIVSLERYTVVLLGEKIKLTAPDFERLARTPWPDTSFASSGSKALSLHLALPWSRKAALIALAVDWFKMVRIEGAILSGLKILRLGYRQFRG